MSILPGEIHALAGQNGAGKSTLIRVLAGVEDADRGRVIFRGTERPPTAREASVQLHPPGLRPGREHDGCRELRLGGGLPSPHGLIAWKALEVQTRDALRSIGCDIDPAQKVSALATGQRALVAIARAVAITAEVVVLDEPTAALTAHEVDMLLNALHSLREQGVAMLYVTHRLDEVFRIADRVTVLRDGRVTMTGPVGAITFAETGRIDRRAFDRHLLPRPRPLRKMSRYSRSRVRRSASTGPFRSSCGAASARARRPSRWRARRDRSRALRGGDDPRRHGPRRGRPGRCGQRRDAGDAARDRVRLRPARRGRARRVPDRPRESAPQPEVGAGSSLPVEASRSSQWRGS